VLDKTWLRDVKEPPQPENWQRLAGPPVREGGSACLLRRLSAALQLVRAVEVAFGSFFPVARMSVTSEDERYRSLLVHRSSQIRGAP
jgi:hypothetical protein